jgi:hypothetical protein
VVHSALSLFELHCSSCIFQQAVIFKSTETIRTEKSNTSMSHLMSLKRKKSKRTHAGICTRKVQSNPRVAASNRKKEPIQQNRQRQC